MNRHLSPVALITARGGSRGLPRKNIRSFCGKPLIAWTIEAAIEADSFQEVIVSTDDDEIAECALGYGASVPFMRPKELSTDTATSIDVTLHALDFCKWADSVMLLQPTSPLRTAGDIKQLMTLAVNENCESVVSMTEVESHPWLAYHLNSNGVIQRFLPQEPVSTRRQDMPRLFCLNGAMYLSSVNSLTATKSFLNEQTKGFFMPRERSIDIDNELDWKLAELCMQERIG